MELEVVVAGAGIVVEGAGVATGIFVSIFMGGGGGGVTGGGFGVSALPVSFMSCINAARAAAWAGVSSARVEKVLAHKAMAATAGKILKVCIKVSPDFLRQIFLKCNSFCRK
jgi:hypothetical protein